MADALRDWLVAYIPSSAAESPVEALLYAGWVMMEPRLMLTADAGVKVLQQEQVGPYRADFLFRIRDHATGQVKSLVVEVDGHDFHERTKAQAAKDRSRDRWMAQNGYEVMRFTGSEVYANPFKCALEIAERLYLLRFGVNRRESIVRASMEAMRRLLESD
jgi:very-short-patch-repair endonuclease